MKRFHISIEAAPRITKGLSNGNRKHLLHLLGSCHGFRPWTGEMYVFSCVKSSQQSSGTLCMYVSKPRHVCMTLTGFFIGF